MGDMKLVAIMVCVYLVGMFGALAYTEYAKSNCKIIAIEKGMSADDINKLCSK